MLAYIYARAHVRTHKVNTFVHAYIHTCAYLSFLAMSCNYENEGNENIHEINKTIYLFTNTKLTVIPGFQLQRNVDATEHKYITAS